MIHNLYIIQRVSYVSISIRFLSNASIIPQEEYRNSSVRETRAERLGQHLGVTCKRCNVCPIIGKCYK